MIPGDDVGRTKRVMLRIPLLPADRFGTNDRLRTLGITAGHRSVAYLTTVRHQSASAENQRPYVSITK